jgi:hypothetical protein
MGQHRLPAGLFRSYRRGRHDGPIYLELSPIQYSTTCSERSSLSGALDRLHLAARAAASLILCAQNVGRDTLMLDGEVTYRGGSHRRRTVDHLFSKDPGFNA